MSISFDSFLSLREDFNLIPIYSELDLADKSPIAVYESFGDSKNTFLLESAEISSGLGRYSFIGVYPEEVIEIKEGIFYVNNQRSKCQEGDILSFLDKRMRIYKPFRPSDLPPFYGGLVGYLGYDLVFAFEPSLQKLNEKELSLPDALFMLFKEMIIFDHQVNKIFIVVNAFLDEEKKDLEFFYQSIQERIIQLSEKIQNLPSASHFSLSQKNTDVEIQYSSNIEKSIYLENVEKAKSYIQAGDCFQVVLSQRFETSFSQNPYHFYQVLKLLNPSPYMFLFQFADFSIVGSSPETHIRCDENTIKIRPIAGTRKRGENTEEDLLLEKDLLSDEKEIAEHIMLLDLARNDLGKISLTGSIKIDAKMFVEKYSHVMHMVSDVSGKMSSKYNSYDALRATFPAGTVSGSPKVRAMQIIEELEECSRGSYAGIVGYFGWDGVHDSCIMLRTAILYDDCAYVQAGGGIVADSNLEFEYQETVNKALAVLKALAIVKGGNYVIDDR